MQIDYDFKNMNNSSTYLNYELNDFNNTYAANKKFKSSVHGSGEKIDIIKIYEKWLKELSQETDLLISLITELEELSIKYPVQDQDKKMIIIKKADENIKKINKILSGTHYTTDSQYWIQTGPYMDHREKFYLGAASSRQNPVITLNSIDFSDFDITKDESLWKPIIHNALTILHTEKKKINAYLIRLNYYESFNDIIKLPGGEYTDIKNDLFTENTADLQTQFIDRTCEYLKLSQKAINDLKSLTQEKLENIEEKKDDIILTASELTDEINRIASHANFNRMKILTGRFAKPVDSFIDFNQFWLNTGYAYGKNQRLYIDDFSFYGLFSRSTEDKLNYNLTLDEIFSSKENINELNKKCNKALEKIDIQLENLDKYKADIKNIKNFEEPFIKLFKQELDQKLINSTDNEFLLIPEPYDDIYTRNKKICALLEHSIEKTLNAILNLKQISGIACNSKIDYEYREKLKKELNENLELIDKIAESTAFYNSKLLTGKFEKPDGINKNSIGLSLLTGINIIDRVKNIGFTSLDSKSLKLKDDNYAINIDDIENANMALGIIDYSLENIYNYRNDLFIFKQIIQINEISDKYLNRLERIYTLPAEMRDEAVIFLVNDILKLNTVILKEMEYYAWMSASSVYTGNDKLAFIEYIQELDKHINGSLGAVKFYLKRGLNNNFFTKDSIEHINKIINLLDNISVYKHRNISNIINRKYDVHVNPLNKEDSASLFINIYASAEQITNEKNRLLNDVKFDIKQLAKENLIADFKMPANDKNFKKLEGIYLSYDLISNEINKILRIVNEVEKLNPEQKDLEKYVKQVKQNIKYINKIKTKIKSINNDYVIKMKFPDSNEITIKLLPVNADIENYLSYAAKTGDIIETLNREIIKAKYNQEIINTYQLVYKADYLIQNKNENPGTIAIELTKDLKPGIIYSVTSAYDEQSRDLFTKNTEIIAKEIKKIIMAYNLNLDKNAMQNIIDISNTKDLNLEMKRSIISILNESLFLLRFNEMK